MSFITVIDELAEILTQSICTQACKHQGANSRLVAMGEAATFYKQQGQNDPFYLQLCGEKCKQTSHISVNLFICAFFMQWDKTKNLHHLPLGLA